MITTIHTRLPDWPVVYDRTARRGGVHLRLPAPSVGGAPDDDEQHHDPQTGHVGVTHG